MCLHWCWLDVLRFVVIVSWVFEGGRRGCGLQGALQVAEGLEVVDGLGLRV